MNSLMINCFVLRFSLAISVVAISVDVAVSGFAAEPEPVFERSVQAILKAHCLKCHGFESRKGDLDLRTRALMLQGGEHGPVLVPGNAQRSRLFKKISNRQMPPEGQLPLTESQIETVRQWIEGGAEVADRERGFSPAEAPAITAEDREFWAFQSFGRPPLPRVRLAASPVDTFVLARLETQGLELSSAATRIVQLRRACFDLIGLPPSPAEVDSFLRDAGPAAYSRLLDRLLASPHFGERWGRHWLDAAGYAEVRGTDYNQELDRKQDYAPGMWLYRQYVIDSLNADKPYDQFLVEQLAGDELVNWRSSDQLSPAARDLLVATGFLRTAPDLTWDPPDNTVITRFAVLHQTVETVASNVLGLTLKCARCHTHKFDPIPQRDYYRILAIFTPALNPHDWLTPHDRDVKNQAQIVHACYDVGPPPPTYLLRRGDLSRPGPVVKPGFLSVLCQTDAEAIRVDAQTAGETTGLRLAFARWLTDSDSRAGALAARVRVNWAWQQLFGRGLVKTSDNFGAQGDRPTHPQLLEWLAAEFVRHNWQLKPLLKKIMMSSTYRQASTLGRVSASVTNRQNAGGKRGPSAGVTLFQRSTTSPGTFPAAKGNRSASAQRLSPATSPEGRSNGIAKAAPSVNPLRVDPDNQLLWHMPVRRLSSEAIRDAMLATSGLLDRSIGRAPVNTEVLLDGRVIIPVEGQDTPTSHCRRSVYTLSRRNFSPTIMSVFDQPRMVAACTQRQHSAVVLQSLTLLNDEFVLAQAESFARRILQESGDRPGECITRAFRLALARQPTQREVRSCQSLLRRQTDRYRKQGLRGEELTTAALACLCQVLFNTSEFLYVE